MKKLAIIVLVVVAVLVIFLVVVRPGGSSSSTKPPGWVELLGSLTPKTKVKAADVSGQQCWSPDGVLTADPGQTCVTVLPKRANQLDICLEKTPFALVRIQGSKYGPQDASPTEDACPTGKEFSLYDDASNLTVTCLPTGSPCVLRLL